MKKLRNVSMNPQRKMPKRMPKPRETLKEQREKDQERLRKSESMTSKSKKKLISAQCVNYNA